MERSSNRLKYVAMQSIRLNLLNLKCDIKEDIGLVWHKTLAHVCYCRRFRIVNRWQKHHSQYPTEKSN